MGAVWRGKDTGVDDGVEIDTDGMSITIKRYSSIEKVIFTVAEWKEVTDFINMELAEIDKEKKG